VIVPIGSLREHLVKEDGVEYEEVGLGEWTVRAVQQGLNVLVAAYLAAIKELKLDIVFQRLTR
jgi:hypothetical protein